MGISIDGGDGLKGVDFLLHYSIELIGRGDVADQGGEIFRLGSDPRLVSAGGKMPTESRSQYRRWSCVTHFLLYLRSPLQTTY